MMNRVDGALPAPRASDHGATEYSLRQLLQVLARNTAVFLAAFGLAISGWYLLDGPVAAYMLNHSHPEPFAEMLAVAEPFGNGVSVLLIAALIWRLDPGNVRRMPRLLVMAIGAGMAADGLKLLVGRWRPISGRFDPADMSSSFVGWLPMFELPSDAQSFPSAHTATAVGLAVALTWIYPRGRALFLVGAMFVGLQRVAYGSHFVSDVFAGAAVGWFVANGTLYSPHLARLFRWIEGPRTAACHPQAIDGVRLRTDTIPAPQSFRSGQVLEPGAQQSRTRPGRHAA